MAKSPPDNTLAKRIWWQNQDVKKWNQLRGLARQRAFKRLAHAHPEEFERLFAEELPFDGKSLTAYREWAARPALIDGSQTQENGS